MEGAVIPWALNAKRRYSLDPGWREGVFSGSWMEGESISWALYEGVRVFLGLEWREEHSVGLRIEEILPGPWVEGEGIP